MRLLDGETRRSEGYLDELKQIVVLISERVAALDVRYEWVYILFSYQKTMPSHVPSPTP